MPDFTPKYGDLVQFKEAIATFKNKSLLPTKSFDELRGLIHSKAFTVAGATKLQLLQDLYSAVTHSIENGETITDFRKRFDKTVATHGWSYNGKRGWRTQTIYQNNKNTARAAGRWQQQLRTAKTRPFLLYLTAGDERVRALHNKWHYIVLPIDHPFWTTHYPPNGWGCRCKVMSVNERDIKRMGLKITNSESLSKYLTPIENIDEKTGEFITKLPGIDIGWDYNPGKGWLGSDVAIGKSLIELNSDLRKIAIPNFNKGISKSNSYVKQQVINVAAKVTTKINVDASNVITLGHLSNPIIDAAFVKGAGLFNSAVVINEAVMFTALKSGVALDSMTNLMSYIHSLGEFTLSDGLVKLAYKDLLITIELGKSVNTVILIEST